MQNMRKTIFAFFFSMFSQFSLYCGTYANNAKYELIFSRFFRFFAFFRDLLFSSAGYTFEEVIES